MTFSEFLKIFCFFTILLFGSFIQTSMSKSFNVKKDFGEIPYFNFNDKKFISQRGEIAASRSSQFPSLLKIIIEDKSPLELIDNFYSIQEILLIKDLHIAKLEYKNFGQIKIHTINKKLITFQDFKLENQLTYLKLFFESEESNNLLIDFKSIDLRHKNKIAIGYI